MDEQIIDRIFEKQKQKLSLKAWMKAYLQELDSSDETDKQSIEAMKYVSSRLEV